MAPNYISHLLVPYVSSRPLWSSALNLLTVPKTCYKTRSDLVFLAGHLASLTMLSLFLKTAENAAF